MNFTDGDHIKYGAVLIKILDDKPLSLEDKKLIAKALENTIEDAYWSTGGRR